MRQETINVCQFSELSDRAKERARDWYRSCMDCDDWNSTEWLASINAFADHYGFSISDYQIGAGQGCHIDCDFSRLEDDVRELSGVRLWKYLGNQCGTPQQDGHEFILSAADGSCPFTGTYTDCPAFDTLREFVQRPDNRQFDQLMQECMETVLAAIREEVEYRYSDEAIDESIESNEYKFTEDGEHYA